MIIERINNPWFRFKLLHSTLKGEEERSKSAKEAFLYVIFHYNAFKFQKAEVLAEIAEVYPDIVDAVCDGENPDCFKTFCKAAERQKIRTEFEWTLTDKEKLEQVREVLQDESVGNKKKLELAKEFGEPTEEYSRPYFQKLLYDRHYDNASELGVSDFETIMEVILGNIDHGYFQDALDIAKRFRTDREDLADEIQKLIDTFNH